MPGGLSSIKEIPRGLLLASSIHRDESIRGYWAKASFSSQMVPCLSGAHITRIPAVGPAQYTTLGLRFGTNPSCNAAPNRNGKVILAPAAIVSLDITDCAITIFLVLLFATGR
jgi:hypothetical protein